MHRCLSQIHLVRLSSTSFQDEMARLDTLRRHQIANEGVGAFGSLVWIRHVETFHYLFVVWNGKREENGQIENINKKILQILCCMSGGGKSFCCMLFYFLFSHRQECFARAPA